MVLIMEITHTSDDLAEAYITIIPFVQAVVVLEAVVGSLGDYHWPAHARLHALGSTFYMLAFMLIYMFAGLLFAWRGKCRFRKNIF